MIKPIKKNYMFVNKTGISGDCTDYDNVLIKDMDIFFVASDYVSKDYYVNDVVLFLETMYGCSLIEFFSAWFSYFGEEIKGVEFE